MKFEEHCPYKFFFKKSFIINITQHVHLFVLYMCLVLTINLVFINY